MQRSAPLLLAAIYAFSGCRDAEVAEVTCDARRLKSELLQKKLFCDISGKKTALTPITAIYLSQKNVVSLDVSVQQSHIVQFVKAVAYINGKLQLIRPTQTHGWTLVVLSTVEQRAKRTLRIPIHDNTHP